MESGPQGPLSRARGGYKHGRTGARAPYAEEAVHEEVDSFRALPGLDATSIDSALCAEALCQTSPGKNTAALGQGPQYAEEAVHEEVDSFRALPGLDATSIDSALCAEALC